MRDSITGVTQTLGCNDAGQLARVDYGGGRLRQFTYDDLGRLTLDELTASASVDYDYDLKDRLTKKETVGLAGAGLNTYGYDNADRLTRWTSQPAGGTATTTAYGWDKAGNRTSAGGRTSTYDERNRLLSDGTDTYT